MATRRSGGPSRQTPTAAPATPTRNAGERAQHPDDQAFYATYEAKIAIEGAARSIVDRRAERGETASPYDYLADALLNVISDAVFDVLNSPDFAHALRRAGYIIAPIVDGPVPDAPSEWLQDGIDLYGASGTPTYIVERLDAMWRQAFTAGWHARGGGTSVPQEV